VNTELKLVLIWRLACLKLRWQYAERELALTLFYCQIGVNHHRKDSCQFGWMKTSKGRRKRLNLQTWQCLTRLMDWGCLSRRLFLLRYTWLLELLPTSNVNNATRRPRAASFQPPCGLTGWKYCFLLVFYHASAIIHYNSTSPLHQLATQTCSTLLWRAIG
jgi:hypothetical protein